MTQGEPDARDTSDPFAAPGDIPFGVPVARPVLGMPCQPVDVAPLLVPPFSRLRAFLELGILGVVMLGAALLLGMLLDQLGFVDEQYNIDSWGNVLGVAVNGAAAIVCIIALTLLRGGRLAEVGLTGRRLAWNVLLGLGAFLAAIAAFQFIGLLITFLAKGQPLNENIGKIKEMLPRMHWLQFLALSFWVGLWEELTFRGFLLTRLRRITGSWWAAILLGAALFALPHMGQQVALAVLPLFVIGIIWSVFTVWRQSLLPAIIGHALFNFAQLFFLFYYKEIVAFFQELAPPPA
ncbi:MAG: CPBP family intramembrane metalloprotease [Phycisphaerae bacterium]|nr:CPBP family intramembrane metalloprotease [Phycisphaerae bacterium]